MNRYPPVNWWKVTGESLCFIFFCVSLYHLFDVTAQKDAYRRACATLSSQEQHLQSLEASLATYRLLRDRYLPCRQMDENLVWQDITVSFRNIDFSTLLERLHFLYTDISSLYGEEGMFFLDEFRFERKSAKETAGKPLASSMAVERKFIIKGRLLTPCSAD